MQLHYLPTELLLQIFLSCQSVTDALNLACTCRHLYRIISTSLNKLHILTVAARSEFGPLEDVIQIVTHNFSQPVHVLREAPMSDALLKQVVQIGRVAQKWETIYPVKKWKFDYADRRSLTDEERFRLRRAVYRLWLYHRAFHSRLFDRFSRQLPHVVMERSQLLHNWSTSELAEIEDVRNIIYDVVQNHICPSNGTIQRKFHKRYPESTQQLAFNIHLNYPLANDNDSLFSNPSSHHCKSHAEQSFHSARPATVYNDPAKYRSRFRNDLFHDPGEEGWGDEIRHYYVVQDMMKLDPGQVLWLREHALLKEEVETFVRSLGEWFRDNGETFGDTLAFVMKERGEDVLDLRAAILDREVGIVKD